MLTSCTFVICSFHSLCSRWERETRWFLGASPGLTTAYLVMMLLWMVRMVWVSTRTQATL